MPNNDQKFVSKHFEKSILKGTVEKLEKKIWTYWRQDTNLFGKYRPNLLHNILVGTVSRPSIICRKGLIANDELINKIQIKNAAFTISKLPILLKYEWVMAFLKY